MKKLTFLLTDPTPVKGPYTFARLRELWSAGEINGESRLFVTENDEQNKVRLLNITAESIRDNLETGTEINLDKLLLQRIPGLTVGHKDA